MLSINDLQNGILVKINNDPYVVASVKHLHMGRGASSIQTKLRNLRTGQVFERNFRPSDEFEEVEIEKMKSRFLYESKGLYWFDETGNPKNRFSLNKEELGDASNFLKANIEATAIKFEGKIISIELPVKIDFKVVEAPPSIKGDTASGGTKVVIIESGTKISTPFFINEGDVIKVNTQTGEYVERVEKVEKGQ